jgi:hypothetical protein
MKYVIAGMFLCLSSNAFAVLYCASSRPVMNQTVTTSILQTPVKEFKDGSHVTCGDNQFGSYFFYSVRGARYKLDSGLCAQIQREIESDFQFRFLTRAAFDFSIDSKNCLVTSVTRKQVVGGGCGGVKNP